MQKESYEIIERNVNYSCGEIDLVARKQREIIFVEVRSRASANFGSPEETVDRNKQRKLIAAAELWLQKNDPSGNYHCRFDVIGITGDTSRWIKNAFEAY